MKYQTKEEIELNANRYQSCGLAVAVMIGFVVGIIFGLIM